MSNFHAIPRQLKSHSYFPKLDDEVCTHQEADLIDTQHRGWVFNIQRYSTQDGPGIRTTVFLKGCPLICPWCSNCESQSPQQDLLFFAERCDTECDDCVEVCPVHAIKVRAGGYKEIVRSCCNFCGKCEEVCPKEALAISGKMMVVDEVMAEIKKDALFYRNSNGGVTLSGGEPAFQGDFAREILKQCRENGFYTCLDTCGYAKEETFDSVIEETDLVYFDLKHMDPGRHKELTGVDNSLILKNAQAVVSKGKSMTLRIPLIPTYNDSDENIQAIGRFALELGVSEIHLLPYHRLGISKFPALGMEYKLAHLDSYRKEEVARIRAVLELMVHQDCKIEIV